MNWDFTFNLYSNYPDYRMIVLEDRIIAVLFPSRCSLLVVSLFTANVCVHILLALLLPYQGLVEP